MSIKYRNYLSKIKTIDHKCDTESLYDIFNKMSFCTLNKINKGDITRNSVYVDNGVIDNIDVDNIIIINIFNNDGVIDNANVYIDRTFMNNFLEVIEVNKNEVIEELNLNDFTLHQLKLFIVDITKLNTPDFIRDIYETNKKINGDYNKSNSINFQYKIIIVIVLIFAIIINFYMIA